MHRQARMHACHKAVTYVDKLVAAMQKGLRNKWCKKEFKTGTAEDREWKEGFLSQFHIIQTIYTEAHSVHSVLTTME
jgi:hypothetical protein